MSKPSRKHLNDKIRELSAEVLKQREFIQNECISKSALTQLYGTLRVAIQEALGDEAVKKVVAHMRELTAQEVYQHKAESEEFFPEILKQDHKNTIQ